MCERFTRTMPYMRTCNLVSSATIQEITGIPKRLCQAILLTLLLFHLQHSNGSTRKKRKYSIGVIICLSELSKTDIRLFQSFIFSHFTLIDAHLERLRLGVEEACSSRIQAVVEATITRAYHTFLEDFLSLYTAPRIEVCVCAYVF